MSQRSEPERVAPSFTPENVPESSAMLSSLAVGIATLDHHHAVASWNARAEQITGYTRAQMQGTDLTRIFEPTGVLQDILAKAQRGVDAWPTGVQLRQADSTLVSVVVQGAPQPGRDGRVGQVVVAFQALEPLQPYRHGWELGQLAGPLAHEIHNPLNAIFLHLDVLEEELQEPTPHSREQMAESLAEIKSEVTRLNDLVQDYLALARLPNLPREPTDLSAMVEAVVLERQEHCETRRILLHVEGLETLGPVRLQRNTFHRMLLNLTENAIAAMPQGGTLTFRGRRDPTHVCLQIQDTGNGIAEDALPTLFRPFQTIPPDGTGLGLYTAQQIVRFHGGEMTAASTPGVGTTYTINLPRSLDTTVGRA